MRILSGFFFKQFFDKSQNQDADGIVSTKSVVHVSTLGDIALGFCEITIFGAVYSSKMTIYFHYYLRLAEPAVHF
jgi:hypothetical protein